LAIAALQAHAPPVLTQKIAKSGALPVLQIGEETQEVNAPINAPQDTAYSPVTLNAELRKLQSMHRSLIDFLSIDLKTVRVARLISHQIPAPVAPSIGFDDAGNVFLHFKDERVSAYLTVEQRVLHLFCKVVNQRNTYIDNEPFNGKRLPTKIRDKLSEIFAT
jgi:hypothetical protein